MPDAHKNLAYSTVATAPSPADTGTSLTVASGDGALFPAPPFNATVWPADKLPLNSNAEIVRVTGIADDVFTVTRAQEGTAAKSIAVGYQIAATVTAKTLTDIEDTRAGVNAAITGGSITVNTSGVSVNLPAYLTTAALSQDSSKYAATGFATTTIAGAVVAGTHNTAGMTLAVPAYLTTAQAPGAYLTTAALSQDSSKYAFTGFTTTTIAGAVVAGTHDSDGLKLAVPDYLTTAQSPGAYLTTAMASNRGSDFVQAAAAFAGTNASGTIASGGISVSVGNYLTTAMASNRGSDFVQATAAFAGTSASGTIASGGISVSIGPYLTTAMASNRGSDFVQATAAFAGTSASGTINSTGISVSVGPYITTAMLSNAATLSNVKISAGTLSALRSDLTFSNASGVSWGLETNGVLTATVKTDYLTTAALSNHSHGNPTLALTNLSGTTASASNGLTLSLSAAAPGGGDAIRGIAIGASTATTNSVLFSNLNGVSFGFGGAGAETVITASYSSNHSHGNPTLALTNISGTTASASNGLTLSLSVAAPGGAEVKSYHRVADPINTVTFSFAQSTSHFVPFEISAPLSINLLRIVASGSVAASSTQATTGNISHSMSGITSHNIVLYSRGVGGNSMSLQSVTSTRIVDQCLMTRSFAAGNSSQQSISLRYTLGTFSATKDYSSSVTRQDWHTSHLTNLTGVRYLDLPLGVSMSAGQWWIGYGRSTASATQNASISVATRMLVSHNSMVGISMNTLQLGMVGDATRASVGWLPGHGSFTTNGAAGTTNSLPISAVSTTASNIMLYMQFMRIA